MNPIDKVPGSGQSIAMTKTGNELSSYFKRKARGMAKRAEMKRLKEDTALVIAVAEKSGWSK